MLMKVVLIHPPHPNSMDDRLDCPLGLLYIANNLIMHDIDVEVVDLSGQDYFFIPYADVYGITVYITSIGITKEIISLCKKVNPNCKIVLGAHPTARPNDFPYVDHIVRGYGEVAMVNIVKGKETDHIIIGKEPDTYLWPDYDLVDIKSYHRRIAGEISLPLLTSRGCPYHCAFCGLEQIHKSLGYNVKFDSIENVEYQIERIKCRGVNAINFQDDIFVIQPKRLFKILDVVKEMNMKFRCMGRAGLDKEYIYERLSESGCESVAWGLESGSQYMLNRMNKGVTVQDNYNVIKWAKKNKIISRAFFLIGFPGETRQSLEETKEFILKSEPDQVFVSTMVPYPGTSVGDNPKKYGITWLSKDYSQYYQVSKDGTGGVTFDTEWLNHNEFRELELDFREFIKKYMKSKPQEKLQDYEKNLYKND
jgi:anaerobic magnesium-protoporphyrin IX monomethyl ester cyclase